jgi:uncharacterized lipoprotein YajG
MKKNYTTKFNSESLIQTPNSKLKSVLNPKLANTQKKNISDQYLSTSLKNEKFSEKNQQIGTVSCTKLNSITENVQLHNLIQKYSSAKDCMTSPELKS